MSIRAAYEQTLTTMSAQRIRAAQTYLQDVWDGHVPSWWVDSFCQHSGLSRSSLSLVDAASMQLWEVYLRIGYLCVSRVYVGEGPEADEDVSKNQGILDAACPQVRAHVRGGAGVKDNDGSAVVPENLMFYTFMEPPGPEVTSLSGLILPSYPLEIGTTGGHNTVWHLNRARGLVRWPYGHEYLYYFRYCGPHWVEMLDDDWAEVLDDENLDMKRRWKQALEESQVPATRALTIFWQEPSAEPLRVVQVRRPKDVARSEVT